MVLLVQPLLTQFNLVTKGVFSASIPNDPSLLTVNPSALQYTQMPQVRSLTVDLEQSLRFQLAKAYF